MLINIDVCRKDSDQQSNDAPGRKPRESRDEETNPQHNFKGTAQIDQLQVKRQIGRHNFEEEAWTNEVHRPCKKHEDRQKPFESRFDCCHAILGGFPNQGINGATAHTSPTPTIRLPTTTRNQT